MGYLDEVNNFMFDGSQPPPPGRDRIETFEIGNKPIPTPAPTPTPNPAGNTGGDN